MRVSDLMQQMSEAGAPLEAILIAVRAIEEREGAVEAKRAVERDRKRRQRAKAKDAGRDSHGTVPGQSKDNGDGTPPSLPPNEINSNPPTHPPVDITPARKGDFPKPDWCDPQVWRDLKANRKAKRLPCTATAHAKLLRDLEKMADDEWPPGRLLEAIVARGWAAAYDPRDDRKPRNDNRRQGNSNRNTADLTRQKLGLGQG